MAGLSLSQLDSTLPPPPPRRNRLKPEASGLCPETRQGGFAPLDPPPKGEALWNLLMALMRGVANRDIARPVSATPLINATNGSRGHCPWRGSQGQSPLVGFGAKPR